MKPQPKSLKLIALLLSAMILFQGCISVYEPASLEQSISQTNRIKVKTNQKETYKFISMYMYQDRLFGVTKYNSTTAKKMTNYVVSSANSLNTVQIDLSGIDIKEISVMNEGLSILANVLVIGIVLYLTGSYIAANISIY